MERSLEELAAALGGVVDGDGTTIIRGVAGLTEASSGDITFLANPKYRPQLRGCKAAALIAAAREADFPGPHIIHPNPYLALAKVLSLFHQKGEPAPRLRRGQACHISPTASLGKDVSIFPFVYVGEGAVIEDRVKLYPGVFVGDGAAIGEDSVVHANACIRERCIIGRRVIIHCGAVIGSDGFGYAREGRTSVKIPQVGNVRVDDDVEIGANVTVDRATMGTTWIKRGVKIDNLVQVGHNVVIGEDSVIVAQVGISGSTTLGRDVTLGGQVGVAGHVTIGDGVTVAGQSGVTKDVPPGQTVSGLPVVPHRQWLKAQMSFLKLPDIRRALIAIERRLEELEKRWRGHA